MYGQEYPTSTLEYPRFLADGGNQHGGPETGYLVENLNPQNLGGQPPYINGNRQDTPSKENAFVTVYAPDGASASTRSAAQANARAAWAQVSDAQHVHWARYGTDATTFLSFEVRGGATAECRALGYRRATGVKWRYLEVGGSTYTGTSVVVNTSPYVYRAFRYLLYTAVCRGRYTPPSGG